MVDNVQQIKDKLDIAEYIRSYMMLTPAGKNLKGLCPFHKEKTPSFMVSPDRQIWHCFGGCNSGGDIFSFVMKYENVEFYEALKILAEKAGVELKQSGGDWQKYNKLYEINQAAKDFFQQALKKDQAVKDYLQERGLQEPIIEEFELGLAGHNNDALLRFLVGRGFGVDDIEKAGLAIRTERGTYWDRFRDRLMFPLYNSFAKVIGFTGRLLPESSEVLAKYINSPETPIFQKSKFLYGFHKAKNFIRETNAAILVEGQMDFLLAWQDGLKNVCATSGTALTADHLTALKRVTDQLVLSFDNDSAGQAAVERSIDLAFANDFSVKVFMVPKQFEEVSLAEAKDPADIVRAHPGLLKQLMAEAVPAMEYYFRRQLINPSTNLGQTTDAYQKKKSLRVILQKIKTVASPIEQSVWLQELERRSGIAASVLAEEFQALVKSDSGKIHSRRKPTLVAQTDDSELRKDRIVKRIFGVLYHNPELVPIILVDKSFFPIRYGELFDYFVRLQPETSASESIKPLVDIISLLPPGTKGELLELLHQLKLEFYRHRQRGLKLAIERYEKLGDETALAKTMVEFDNVSRQLHNVITYIQTHGQQKKEDQSEEIRKVSQSADRQEGQTAAFEEASEA